MTANSPATKMQKHNTETAPTELSFENWSKLHCKNNGEDMQYQKSKV